MDACGIETRPSSGRSDSPDFAQQMTESTPMEWTDEKHSLYLKSMEATFVNQLYNSIDLFDLQLKEETSDLKLSEQVHSSVRTPSGQFKVLRGGCWKKINFQRPDLQVNPPNQPHGLLISPWIRHFRSARKPQGAVQDRAASQNLATNSSRKTCSGTAACSQHSYLCRCYSFHHGPVDNNTEVSDQNFVDENIKSDNTSRTCSSKRMKTQKIVTSINDQVVPRGKPASCS